MSFRPQQVLVSRWGVSSLWWTDGSGWTWMHDRPDGALSDDEVLGKYGDEAFRRRDLLRTSGERVFEPALTKLVGRRVAETVSRGGWEVIADDPRHFRARRGDEILEVNGDVPEKLRLIGAGEVNSSRVDEAERWLLTRALGDSAVLQLDEIVSVQGQRSTTHVEKSVAMSVRDVRADEKYFADVIANLDKFCATYDKALASPPLEGNPTHAMGVEAGDAMGSQWARFSSRYSWGAPASGLRDDFEQVLAAAERAVRLEKQTIHEDLFVRRFAFGKNKDFYREWLCLVSVALAFDVDDATFDRVVSAVEIGWGDRLLDRLIRVRRPEHPLGEELAFPRIVGPLDQAFEEPDAMKAQKLITRYLAKWYPSWKGTWGWGGHEFQDKFHYWGYWAFEAVGVVAALRLDDSSFRDNEYYPKDLAGL